MSVCVPRTLITERPSLFVADVRPAAKRRAARNRTSRPQRISYHLRLPRHPDCCGTRGLGRRQGRRNRFGWVAFMHHAAGAHSRQAYSENLPGEHTPDHVVALGYSTRRSVRDVKQEDRPAYAVEQWRQQTARCDN